MSRLTRGRRLPARPFLAALGLACVLASVAWATAQDKTAGKAEIKAWKNIKLVYLTDVKGEIEQCGCKSQPRGGLARRATVVDQVWGKGKPVLNLDAGDLFGPRNSSAREQTRFLCETLAGFGLDAVGLGEQDLNYGLAFLHQMMTEHRLPFTNANVRDATTGELILPAYRVVERDGVKYGVVSVLDPQSQFLSLEANSPMLTIADPVTTLRELLPRLRQDADCVVLLGHLGESGCEALLKEVQGIDICVIGHSYRNLESERVVNDTAVFCAAYEGRSLGRADLFIEEGTGRVMAIDVGITELDDKIVDDAGIKAKVDKFKTDLSAFREANRAAFPRVHGSDQESYLGERACFTCHEASWQAYAGSAHRRAFASLRADGQTAEPACLSCHTTGYQFRNGYAEERPFNTLVNVQCEACHGYGTQHARDGKWREQARNSCTGCHDQKNSPNFDYASYWEKIKH